MKQTYLYTGIFALSMVLSASACSDKNEVFGVPDIKQPIPKVVNIQGSVKSEDGTPLAGVSVSDGYNITQTDANGNYVLPSEVTLGMVFVSTPNGYEPVEKLNNNRPKFWESISKAAEINVDFELRKIDSKPVGIITVADPQISDRCGDVERLKNMIVPDINNTLDSLRNLGLDPIVITQGDLICDKFLIDGFNYTMDRFNADFAVNAPVYNTMGNHDYDPTATGVHPGFFYWYLLNGPSYYSFNRGGAHFIIINNMSYDVASKSSDDTHINAEQLEWIKQDLATVADKNAPLFISMHGIFLTYPVGEDQIITNYWRFSNAAELGALLADFKNVKVFSGHAHNNHYQHTPEGNIFEYNYGGSNGGWWPRAFKPYEANLSLCFDGSPWGYGVWDLRNMQNPSHLYKGYNLPIDYQIRAYDLNNVVVTEPNLDLDNAYKAGANTNVVLANVWGYEPGATVKMFEDGNELTVKRVRAQDPYLLAKFLQPIKADVATWPSWNSSMNAERTAHMFRAQASTADKPITIEFTDITGRKFTTVLKRPAQLPEKY